MAGDHIGLDNHSFSDAQEQAHSSAQSTCREEDAEISKGNDDVQDLERGQAAAVHSRRDRTLTLTDQTNLLPFRKVVPIFAGLAVCIVVSTLDMTLVATALPSISADFNAGMLPSFCGCHWLISSVY